MIFKVVLNQTDLLKYRDFVTAFYLIILFYDIRHKENEDRNTCNVMNIEQQNRIVTESFTWNDSSILTGDIIVGAEMISDKKVETHIKSQMEIDEDATNVYNRIYPGDFRIIVDPSIVEDITMAKKPPNIEGCGKSNN